MRRVLQQGDSISRKLICPTPPFVFPNVYLRKTTVTGYCDNSRNTLFPVGVIYFRFANCINLELGNKLRLTFTIKVVHSSSTYVLFTRLIVSLASARWS